MLHLDPRTAYNMQSQICLGWGQADSKTRHQGRTSHGKLRSRVTYTTQVREVTYALLTGDRTRDYESNV